MKIYVWEEMLSDYYPGLGVAVAPNLRAAKKAIREAYGVKSAYLESDLKQPPKVITITDDMPAIAWTVSGGG